MEADLTRCSWVNLKNPRYVAYHDREWGRASHDDGYLFELLLLECFQAGLSWETILNKREAFRTAFDGFDPRRICTYGEEKIDALLQNPGIIRHRKKIEGAICNAGVFLSIQEAYGSFDRYIWSFTQGKTVLREGGPALTTSPLSDAVSRDLKRRGMRFVGSTTIYSYLQAIGVVNDHQTNCFCRRAKPL